MQLQSSPLRVRRVIVRFIGAHLSAKQRVDEFRPPRGLEMLQADAAALRRKHVEPSRQTLTRRKPNADS